MNRRLSLLSSLLLLGSVVQLAVAQTPQFDPDALNESTAYQRGVNYRSTRGVPLSTTQNNPVGSDARGFDDQTPSQFKSVLSSGGLVHPGPTKTAAVFAGGPIVGSYEANAVALGLPHNQVGAVAVVLSRAVMGSPYFSRATTVKFGSIIAPPDTDEGGVAITGQTPTDYWRPEPLGHTDDPVLDRYYWSPHAGVVFATTPGPISIKWRKAKPEPTPVLNTTNRITAGTLVQDSGLFFAVTNVPYVVSGSPSADNRPRTMYWTERTFSTFGKIVPVPQSKVSQVHFVYNSGFKETVAPDKVYYAPGETLGVINSNTLTRTIWVENNAIHANNAVGRLFVELLGESLPGGIRKFLGSEVVDVEQFAQPKPLAVDLGDAIAPESNGTNPEGLRPERVFLDSDSLKFLFENASSSGGDSVFYAAYATANQNDALIHWTESGVAGLRWPRVFAAYQIGWPSNPAAYVHYIRSAVSSPTEASRTVVSLPAGSNPVISYQDDLGVGFGGFPLSSGGYYSFLDAEHPVHRALLRFQKGNAVAFTRVFSWLDAGLKSPVDLLSGTVATNLIGWGGGTLITETTAIAPRVLSQTVAVGDRIPVPLNEAGATGAYLAGHINLAQGNSFDVTAYQDPLVGGFAAANQGAIIPVNAIPGANYLEVWWFRRQATNVVLNQSNGFAPVYWPSVIGQYTLQWPASLDEIVLASNAGSGPLPSLQATGSIYVQNDPTAAGYNPNEEHALMLGGQAYALRDDLNLTDGATPAVLAGGSATYSSDPFVLLRYLESDGRPAMHPFRVLREKPAAGIVFDYVVQAGGNADSGGAGKILQAPMPLPFLPPPLETVSYFDTVVDPSDPLYGIAQFAQSLLSFFPQVTAYDLVINRNTETSKEAGDVPDNWGTGLASQYPNYSKFTYRDRKDNFWVLRGLHAGLPALDAGTYDPGSHTFSHTLPAATAVLGLPFTNHFHASRQTLAVALKSGSTAPTGLNVDGLTFAGTPVNVPGLTYPITTTLTFVIADAGDGASVEVVLPLTIVSSGTPVQQGPLTLTSTSPLTGNPITFVGRPPFLADPAQPTNSFSMQFFYKTQAGFAWPGIDAPPEVGTVVPYLRPLDGSGQPQGDPTSKTKSLDIVYRPVWANNPPKMPFGYTLNDAKFGLPAIRGQSSVEVLYQQSIANSGDHTSESVVLHDPERQKTYDLTTTNGLAKIPSSVRSQVLQGKTYFPNLPPHLAKRFYYDPNASALGSLVFKGEYRSGGLGAPYLLLNVLRGEDLATVKNLCPSGNDKANWDAAVDGLATTLETFVESPAVKGSYIPDPSTLEVKGVGDLARITHANTAVTSYALSANGPGQGYVTLIVNNSTNPGQTPSGDPVSVYVIKVRGTLWPGEINIIPSDNPLSELSVFQHSLDLGGNFADYEYEWKIAPPVDGAPPVANQYQPLTAGGGIPRYTLGGSGIQTLVDNYIILRYRPLNPDHPLYHAENRDLAWSAWTDPQSAEGWIKRVLAGINPFNQRVTDLYNNTVNTDANILTAAGTRWEGDIPLNLATINDYGLIQIYETVLKKGRGLSIDAGINFGPANDALLLAAGYLNDLYMLVGNEAYADAANPTIGIGTKNNTYGDIATALFAFKGQEPSLLEEELALLRGRNDTLVPGVQTAPVYNRLVWNYTRGIDAGEVIYALNYNILDQNNDGKVDAADAAKIFPQGHGDAYGHYLTAVKGYYSLLLNNQFSWRPSSEAVTILGKAVAVDYQDERKFATAAAAVARAGRQIFDLIWRRDYVPGKNAGWEHFGATRVSQRTVLDATGTTTNSIIREWGADQWASRVEQGAFLNWIVGNAILPSVDPDPNHEGIQKIDRTTVPELTELATLISGLQGDLDTAEGGLTPLGLSEGSLAFDIDPNLVTGANPQSHFEQVYARSKMALNNAVVAFDDAKDVTRLMRSEQDSLEDFQTEYDKQELAYTSSLIEIYGTPYPDEIGAGKQWPQGYEGADLFNYRYVDNPEFINGASTDPLNPSGFDANGNAGNNVWDANGGAGQVYKIDIQATTAATSAWPYQLGTNTLIVPSFLPDGSANPAYLNHVHYVEFPWGPHGFLDKPTTFKGKRKSPGKLQADISKVIAAYNHLFNSITANMVSDKEDLDKSLQLFNALTQQLTAMRANFVNSQANSLTEDRLLRFQELANLGSDYLKQTIEDLDAGVTAGIPDTFIAGLAAGGSVGAPAIGLIKFANANVISIISGLSYVLNVEVMSALDNIETAQQALDLSDFDLDSTGQLQQAAADLGHGIKQVQGDWILINQDTRALQDAYENYRKDLAAGDRLQIEREVFRKRAAAVVQGFRTRDAAFRIFRNEKLERYKALFDLAARYSYLAANAYDYETGLLNTDAGKSFINRIVSARALGVIKNGEPQYGGSNSGDPGLSSALAEMKADWDVLRGRLGFNNPDAYGTTVSLRQEDRRILPGADGDTVWQDVLQQSMRDNLLNDPDVRRHCLQIDPGTGLPVPGIVLEFSTSINPGENLFGRPLAAGDSAFHRSSFATKVYAAGVALEGYVGMNNPLANGSAIGAAGGTSPPDPIFLNPDALAATPYVYLIPVGVDAMRSPPLGDASGIRTWDVQDVTIPMPFNIGASDFSSKKLYQTSDSLSEPLFGVRKHQAFRPVSTTAAFNADIYGLGGSLQPSQFTNRRLIGRSVWNSKWKLVIPGDSLLHDPKEGLARFVKTVKDVKLHFVTYSYSGN